MEIARKIRGPLIILKKKKSLNLKSIKKAELF